MAGRINRKVCLLGISFHAESEFGIHFVSGSTVTARVILMLRTDIENEVHVNDFKVAPVEEAVFLV